MNLANKITMFRIILVPVFIATFYLNIENSLTIAGLIFVIASVTDAIDGHIARSRNMITSFGKFMDPLADKILVSSALICLVEIQKVPAWIVIGIIAREFAITGFRTIAVSEGITIAASPLGKIKTITQILAISLLLFNNFPFSYINIPMDIILLYVCFVFTMLSGIDYIYRNKSVLKFTNNQ